MEKMNNLKKILEEATSIGVASHIDPDGDNLGSIAALTLSLEAYGKDVHLIVDDYVPEIYRFIPGLDRRVKSEEVGEVDLFFALDSADEGRMSPGVQEIFNKSKKKVVIDHHRTNPGYGDLNFIEMVSSTGELLYEILSSLKLPINKEIATGLYTAISSDTGSFKYDSTRPRTHEIAAHLLAYDLDLNEITKNLYQRRSLAKTNLLTKALDSLEFYYQGKVAMTFIDKEDILSLGAKHSDTEGIVEFIRDIDGVDLSIFLKERKLDGTKISIRSKGEVDATKIVQVFHGGGHKRAAGATYPGDFAACKEDLLKILDGVMDEGHSTR